MLDMRTIIFSYVITDIVCMVIILLLWQQTRRRFAGTAFFVFDFVLQTIALFLIILRGSIPDWMSMVLANALAIIGALLGYMGLLRFIGKKSSQIHNYVLITAFVLIHAYFALVQPNLAARNLNLSIVLLIICLQCACLMLRGVEPGMRQLTRVVGIVFILYCLVSMVRIVEYFTGSHSTGDYLQSGAFEQLVLISNQMLFILLTYSLVLMFNKRLLVDVKMGEEKFSKAFQSSPYALTITRLSDGQIIEVNDSFFNITGYQLADIRGKTTIDMHLWDRAEDRAFVLGELASKGKVLECEFPFRKKSGERITGLFSAEIINVDNEKYVLSSINDITERRRMDDTLQETNQQLRLITDNVRDTIWLMDMDMRTTWISPSVVRTRGYTLSELGEMPMDRHFTPRSLARMMELSAIHLTPERLADPSVEISVSEELEYYRKDGSTFWADTVIALLRDNDGMPSGFMGVGRDITERKCVEDALMQANDRLALATVAGGVGIWDLDVVNNKLTWDDQMFRLYGVAPDNFGGVYETWKARVHPEDVEQSDAEVQMALRGEKEFDTVFRVVWPSGIIKHIHARAHVHRDVAGQPLRLIGTNYDISESKRGEDDIIRLNAELENKVVQRTKDLHNSQMALLNMVEDLNASSEKLDAVNRALEATNKELEAFSYSVSHDLRAPLRTIDGFSQALLEDYSKKLDDTGRNYLGKIRRAAQNMGMLIDDLLKLSRITRAEIIYESVDLSEIFQEIAAKTSKNDPTRIVDVIIQKGIIVDGDRHLLEIALTNLIDNAWKFTGKTKNARVEFGTLLTDGKQAMFIRDNGIGFDMTYVDKLFGAFQRLHTTAEFQGTGIGLTIAQRVIHRHGGAIWAEGEVGCGASFYFTLAE